MGKPTHDIIIPTAVMLDKKLNPTSMLIYGELLRDSNVTNKQLSSWYDKSVKTINRHLRLLQKEKYIDISYVDKESKQVFYEMTDGSLFEHNNGCLFCGIDDLTLDKHHYPIPRKDGGIKTINICPNCHRRFHDKMSEIKIKLI